MRERRRVNDTGDATAGSDDHLAADLLPQDAVRRAHVAALLGRDRGGLEPQPRTANCGRGLVYDPVLGLAPVLKGEVEPGERELDPDHLRRQHAERLLEQLLTGLVALEHNDCPCIHGRPILLTSFREHLGSWRVGVVGGARGRRGAFATSTRAAEESTTK